jgi:crotonobetainyl-CoA:carnitine CoA-transferase CaiB-like acyl-CoA transferase
MKMNSGIEGIKVIEAASAVAVPMVGRLLADWGADVIHVDQTARGGLMYRPPATKDVRRIAADFDYVEQNINCNKRSIALDLAQEEGLDILYKLLASADVFINNFRPRELEKFKLEFETLKKINPKLICANLTGFGRKGPEKNEPGFGPTAGDSRSGLLHILQVPGSEPVQTPIAYADFITGMTLAYGIMTALLIRERTGIAQEVDASLFNSLVFVLSSDIAGTLVTGQDRQAVSRKDRNTPLLNIYRTKDKRWLYLMMSRPDVYWSRFCLALEHADWEHDPGLNPSQPDKHDPQALFDALEKTFLTKTLEEWKPRLTEVGFPWAPIQTLPEVVNDPQAEANNFFVPLNHPVHGTIRVMANPAKLSRTKERIKMPAPRFGENTEEVIRELGYTSDDIKKFKEKRIIN